MVKVWFKKVWDDRIMKRIYIYTLGIVCLGIFAVGVLRVWQRTPNKTQDKMWINFCQEKGFLTQKGFGVDSYCEAIKTLAKSEFERVLTETDRGDINEPDLITKDSNIQRFVDLVIRGAKAKRFGKEVKELLGGEIYSSSGEKFPMDKVRLLSKSLAQLAHIQLKYKNNTERALSLGTANIALGTQLSDLSNAAIHMYGVACKSFGLKTLEECAIAQNDKHLMGTILEMREELDKEFETVKNMPPTKPSFWDFFIQCMKSKPDVNKPVLENVDQ